MVCKYSYPEGGANRVVKQRKPKLRTAGYAPAVFVEIFQNAFKLHSYRIRNPWHG